MSNRTKRLGSGKTPFIGQSIVYPVPIQLDAAEYFGAALVGEDGQFYYSNGLEWLVPVEDNLISRPNALVPFTVDEQTQLRLTPYRSPGGIEQAGAIFEISVNGNDFDGSITRIVEGVGVSMYQVLYPEDGFEPGDVILWRAAYVGEGGVQSNFSIPYRQTFPDLITTPSPVTRQNAISGTVIITEFESASVFGYQYFETQIEFYTEGDTPGVDTPIHTMTQQDGAITTIPVPPLETATGYVWRARYGGKITAVSQTVYSEWSVSRTVFVGAASIILQYDLSLALNRTVEIPLGGGTVNNPLNIEIDWGDGQTNTYTDPGIKVHTYDAGYPSNTVQVTVSGTMDWYGTTSAGINQDGLTRVENIGFAMGLTSLRGAFRNTKLALTFVTQNVPETVTDMAYLFANSSAAPNMADFDTRNIQDMSFMFYRSDGVGPNCANWDVRSVTNVYRMFADSEFNSPFSLGNWLSLESMEQMFVRTYNNYYGSPDRYTLFNQPIDYWDVSNVKSMRLMFGSVNGANGGDHYMPFNQPINSWDVSNVTDFFGFMGASNPSLGITGRNAINGIQFNQPLNNWDTSSATNMEAMFSLAVSFNQNINTWDVSNVTNFRRMFASSLYSTTYYQHDFNRDISDWNMSSATTTHRMFDESKFNQPLAGWERIDSTLANVTDMSYMFRNCPFNQPIDNWNVSGVQNMAYMFATASTNNNRSRFNQDIGAWDVSSVQNFQGMFGAVGAGVNQDHFFNNGGSPSINNWDTSSATNMSFMFYTRMDDSNANQAFNQPIGNWDVSNVETMYRMFASGFPVFNQDISQWNLRPEGVNTADMFRCSTSRGIALSEQNYSRLLTGWANTVASQSGPFANSFTASGGVYNTTVYQPGSRFTNAADARAFLVSVRDLTIIGSSDANANGTYTLDLATGIYDNNNPNGYYLLQTGNTWTLYNASDVALASGDGINPWDVTVWTGVLNGATVLIDGAAWTIAGDVAA